MVERASSGGRGAAMLASSFLFSFFFHFEMNLRVLMFGVPGPRDVHLWTWSTTFLHSAAPRAFSLLRELAPHII